jgi:uncharacterized protein
MPSRSGNSRKQEEGSMKNYTIQKAVSQTLNEQTRTLTVVASTEVIDRYGDIVRIAGMNCDNYLKNPVVLWVHDSDSLPVGKCVNLQKTTGATPQLLITIQFATADENPEADKVFKSYKGGFLSAVSIGFLPKAYEMRLEDGVPAGFDFTSSELLELSCVPVPANPQALAKETSFTPPDVQALLQTLTAKPKNTALDDELGEFLEELFNPSAPGSVRELLRGTRK